ncbi:DUF3574 domain-containing protein [Erwinia sp. E602]|uniref:DUF3574 domain-containing protein n=1 Tax=unclassified Erwinia TaxID=2622719 RepID=UPI0006FDF404|nr:MULTISPECIES: DUF3574 domain-containing protein [unclassified Erwinia]KQN63277.1 hypothetical protein ASF13_19925 [Erwinia sp. Leaf53]PLV53279.1 hypothetical protein NV64_18840 [Erwinia sp. B116]QUG77696.1 DUF3574 domain-containing protein [Erwinia sp. E602]
MLIRSVISGVLLLALAGCSAPARQAPPAAACVRGDAMVQTTLYFGLNRPQGAAITPAEWQKFVDDDVTPRFKAGLTVFAAQGQWLGDDGRLAREESRALMLIHPLDQGSEQGIEALRAVYKQRFAQDSVMRVDAPVCVAF